MADQRLWFKVWCSVISDPHLSNLPLEDFGRWVMLGAYVALHGNEGVLEIPAPGLYLTQLFRYEKWEDTISALKRLPKIDLNVSNDATVVIVAFKNWHKYQVDYSTQRSREFRKRATTKKRREEKRREENKNIPPPDKAPPRGGGQNLPDWIPVEQWTDYVEMRQKIRKTMTQRAMELAIMKLDELRQQGEDPGRVLDQSVMHSWQSLYPVKPDALKRIPTGMDALRANIERRKEAERDRSGDECADGGSIGGLPAIPGD